MDVAHKSAPTDGTRNSTSRLAGMQPPDTDSPSGLEVSGFRYGAYSRLRPLFDRTGGLILFIAWLPVMTLAWLAVRLTSAGPGLYTQVRLGLGGRRYRIYKLRTMYHNCEATMGGIRWSGKGDPRVTPLGQVLRKLHIDELPQLWNVITGDMSLVGPRPERPELVPSLAARIPGYHGRLVVPPGLTGLAQIQLPPDTDIESVRLKLSHDLCYIRERSAWLDIRLLVGTVVYLTGFSYSAVRSLLALPSPGSSHRPADDRTNSSGIQTIPSFAYGEAR